MKRLFTLFVLVLTALLAIEIGRTFPILGHSLSAIMIGVALRHSPLYTYIDKKTTNFVAKYFLQTGIVLSGFIFSLNSLNQVGIEALMIITAVVITALSVSHLANKYFKIDPKLSLLIGIGTSISGSMAISLVAPIVEPEDKDMAIANMTMVFYSFVALFLLPSVGLVLDFTDPMYGILAGTSVNQIAAAVTTAYEWSFEAQEIASIMMFTRLLFMVPLTIGVTLWRIKQAKDAQKADPSVKIKVRQMIKWVPTVVVFFWLAATVATVVPMHVLLAAMLSGFGEILITCALIAVGLGVHFEQITKAGIKPLLMGGVTWGSVVAVSVLLIQLFYK